MDMSNSIDGRHTLFGCVSLNAHFLEDMKHMIDVIDHGIQVVLVVICLIIFGAHMNILFIIEV